MSPRRRRDWVPDEGRLSEVGSSGHRRVEQSLTHRGRAGYYRSAQCAPGSGGCSNCATTSVAIAPTRRTSKPTGPAAGAAPTRLSPATKPLVLVGGMPNPKSNSKDSRSTEPVAGRLTMATNHHEPRPRPDRAVNHRSTSVVVVSGLFQNGLGVLWGSDLR